MTVSFSCEQDLITEIEEMSEEILSVLNVFYKEVEDVKITVDIIYSLGKELDINLSSFESILEDMKYERKNTSKNEFRRFEIVKKHNVINLISIRELNNVLEYDVAISIENIVINTANFKSEFINSTYFYAVEYSKLHYNIVDSKDKYYIENNEKFYESLANL